MWKKIKNWIKPIELAPESGSKPALSFSHVENLIYDNRYEDIFNLLPQYEILSPINERSKILDMMCHYIPMDENVQSWFFKVFEQLIINLPLKDFYLSSLLFSCENKNFLLWIQSLVSPQTKLTATLYKSLLVNDFYKKAEIKGLIMHQTFKDYYLFFDLFEIDFKKSVKEDSSVYYVNSLLMVLHLINKRLDLHRDLVVKGFSMLNYFQPSESLKLKVLDCLFNMGMVRHAVAFEILVWELMYALDPEFFLKRYQKKLLENDWINLKDVAVINKNEKLMTTVLSLRPKPKEDEPK